MQGRDRILIVGGDDATRAGTVLGTPHYMPPEQANGRLARVDRRSDVFALGGVLCQLLTGQPTYTGVPAEVAAKAAELADSSRTAAISFFMIVLQKWIVLKS